MALFVRQDFIGHAGNLLHWKIECDELKDPDWECLAIMAFEILPPFSEVIGIPRGGLRLAHWLVYLPAIKRVTDGVRLIVDDVCTTGQSLRRAMSRQDDIGLVVFARGPLPPRCQALFTMTNR